MAKKNETQQLKASSITDHLTFGQKTYGNFRDIFTIEAVLPTVEKGVRGTVMKTFYFQAYVADRLDDGLAVFVMESDLFGVNTILSGETDIPAYHFTGRRVQCFHLGSANEKAYSTRDLANHPLTKIVEALTERCKEFVRTE